MTKIDVKGMTLLDWFAGQALAGVITEDGWTPGHPGSQKEMQRLAQNSYAMAQAMIAEKWRLESGDDE